MLGMGDIDRFLSAPLLDNIAAAEFGRGRERVIERQRSWRRNFPAVGVLLDSDEERAYALAGNYATEAREIVGVWLSLLGGDASDVAAREERAKWVEGFWRTWCQHVWATEDYQRLENGDGGSVGPRERFTLVFDELSARYCAEAVAYVREERKRSVEPSLLTRLTAPLRAVGRGVGGFFFPGRSW